MERGMGEGGAGGVVYKRGKGEAVGKRKSAFLWEGCKPLG